MFAQVSLIDSSLIPGKTTIRQEAEWIWWTNKTCVSQKGAPQARWAHSRQKPPRRSCCVWSVMNASIERNCRWSVASISSWVEKRRRRVLHLCFRSRATKCIDYTTTEARDFCLVLMLPTKSSHGSNISQLHPSLFVYLLVQYRRDILTLVDLQR